MITIVLRGPVYSITAYGIDVISLIVRGLLMTPRTAYFLSVVIEPLEESRQHLAKLVDKPEDSHYLLK